MKIFIVILNWNQPKLTIECVESLHKLKTDKKHQIEIVIVDNGSDEKFPKGKYTLLETGKNLGFAGGNNFGIKYALDHFADYIVILNNDTIVDSNLLANLLKTIEGDKQSLSLRDKKIGIV